ncbi:MAG TPA: DUF1338 domain-containing protein [Bacteroidales bacterium]|jgi:hypothetical protein|nr:DUF1338 domain-containing protein [Bacteroidales bacterium]
METDKIFDKLWTDYTSQNPEAKKVYDCFTAEGETVENDHIAFRTFHDPRINVDVLARPFLAAGYVQRGYYIFEDKHLTAKHFEHVTDKKAPRVFISQLMLEHFSSELQHAVKLSIDRLPENLLFGDELIYSGNQWGTPSFKVYEALRKESEYAAWLYVYGFCANHFTVSINHLKKFSSIQQVNQFLKDKGFRLNDSGGEVKGTPAELLEQSSTRAGILPVMFEEGTFEIPSCYYEFALRWPDTNGELYSGFIAKSADKIFESTDFYKK